MDTKRPAGLAEYKDWLKKEHSVDIKRAEQYYKSVTSKIKDDLEKSDLWKSLRNHAPVSEQNYSLKTEYFLFMNSDLAIFIKPFDSLVTKTFRKNVLENRKWPDPPDGKWILPDACFERINDIIRTQLVVKYLDGVNFVINEIKELLKKQGCEASHFFESRDEGYYAAHIYLKKKFEVPRQDWDTEFLEVPIEIQITTQLQEVIKKLLHKYYEEKRVEFKVERERPWQWEYESEQFVANYLGHILHYVEGMIMDVRKSQEGK